MLVAMLHERSKAAIVNKSFVLIVLLQWIVLALKVIDQRLQTTGVYLPDGTIRQ